MTVAEAEQKPKPGTWPAWMPPGAPEPAEMTRDQVLEELRDRGIDIDPRTLRFWEDRGILPKPIRRWRDGATRSIYPDWLPGAVAYLHRLQENGTPLRHLAPMMRAYYLNTINWQDPLAERLDEARGAAAALARRLEQYVGGLRVVEAELRFRDETGRVVETHTWPIAAE